ncbi:MAG: DUF1656 domain-containing protein [Epsilonproteobacteria bacterium]|nr:MAG: DUF1656 domain-containing protein [Campylobacterota bacterium]
MQPFPHELALGDVYVSPLLVVIILSFIATGLTTVILNKLKLSSYFFYPPLSYLAFVMLYIVFIDAYFIKI